MSPIRLSLWLSTAVFAALAAALILEFSYPLTHDAAPGVLASFAVLRLPNLFYLFALWACRAAAKHLVAGEHFARTTRRLVWQVGLALTLGAAMQTLGVPWLLLLLKGWPGSIGAYDPATLTLAAVGLMMMGLSGLWRQAEQMAQELEEFI